VCFRLEQQAHQIENLEHADCHIPPFANKKDLQVHQMLGKTAVFGHTLAQRSIFARENQFAKSVGLVAKGSQSEPSLSEPSPSEPSISDPSLSIRAPASRVLGGSIAKCLNFECWSCPLSSAL